MNSKLLKILKYRNLKVLAILTAILSLWLYLNPAIQARAMYIFVGTKAPFSVRVQCAKTTENRLEEKFKKPLDFDRISKQQIKGYWVWSLLNQCLHENGYDSKGTKIPNSQVGKDGETYFYNNSYAGISLKSTREIEIIRDNELNVEFDNRLLRSKIKLDKDLVNLDIYIDYEDAYSLEELQNILGNFLTITENIEETKIIDNHLIILTQNTQGCMALTTENVLIHMFTNDTIEEEIDLCKILF